jgi:glycosyltransferase
MKMKNVNLFLMDMINVGAMNGVTRYLNILAGLLSQKNIYHVTWIRFTWDRKLLGIKRIVCDGYVQIIIPLPHDMNRLLGNPHCMRDYNKVVFHLLKEDFEKGGICILHLHTLNLIDLAMYIKQRVPCKIITHLHCIPWKGLYNTDKERFNDLYQKYYLGKGDVRMSDFISKRYELQSYLFSDAVVCVTACAKDFILRFCVVPSSRIRVIYNGMKDECKERDIRRKKVDFPVKCLYVGNMNESKGLHLILKALNLVREKYPVILTVAGQCSQKQREKWQEEYPNLFLKFTGLIPFEELKQCYIDNEIGIIASLQEQCSYVALEMMMFGLPVVTTNVDGLDELFVQNENALKVPTCYDENVGLTVNLEQLSTAILELIEKKNLRERIGHNARHTFIDRFTETRMVEETHNLYQAVLQNDL